MKQQRFVGLRIGLVLIGLCSVGHVGLLVPAVYAENASAEIGVSDGQEAARFLGSSDAKKYHKASCKWVKKITKDNRVEFASKVEAEKAGYAPCKTCFASSKAGRTATHTRRTKKSAEVAQSQ